MKPIDAEIIAFFSDKVYANRQGHSLLDYLPEVAVAEERLETRAHFLCAAAAYLAKLVQSDAFSNETPLDSDTIKSAYCAVEGLCDEALPLLAFGPAHYFETADNGSVLAIAEYLDAAARYLTLRKPGFKTKPPQSSRVMTLYPTLNGLPQEFRASCLRSEEAMDKGLSAAALQNIDTGREAMGFHVKVQSLLVEEMRTISRDIHHLVDQPQPASPSPTRARVLSFRSLKIMKEQP